MPSKSSSATQAAAAATAPSEPGFEQMLAQLEALVAQLETGDLPLEEALGVFERGVRMTRECQKALSAAQQKVQVLLQRGENVLLEDFSADVPAAARRGEDT